MARLFWTAVLDKTCFEKLPLLNIKDQPSRTLTKPNSKLNAKKNDSNNNKPSDNILLGSN